MTAPANKTKLGDPLTEMQERVLRFIKANLLAYGVSPSIREIVAELGFSGTNAVMCHIKPLVKKGYLRQAGRGQSRAYLPTVPEGYCPTCGRPHDRQPQ